jgi:hypothetical protein
MKHPSFLPAGMAAFLVMCMLQGVIAENFVFTSGNPKYDKPFADAKANIAFNTKGSAPNTVFHAGAFWDQVWTRDGSYSIEMACGHIDPQTSGNTFTYTTTTISPYGKVQLQDVCGHFGGWPALTDGIVWATGVWAYYRQNGNAAFLASAYPVIRASLIRAETEVQDKTDGLFRGCASFMESNSAYPPAFANNGAMVGSTKAGSTNMLHYHAYVVADSMARLLGKPQTTIDTLRQKALALKNAINSNLWNPSKGYYYYFKYANGTYLDRNEGLADAFAILYDIADSAKKASILANTVPSQWGYVCQYPQDPAWLDYTRGTADYYHTNKVWPFVCGYIAWAATILKNQNAFMINMDKCAQLWAKSSPGEWREFYHTEDGKPDGGGQQLWSASGYISMVFHGLFGMHFDVDGVRFDPMVPDTFKSVLSLTNFIYRGMTLNMTVQGPGKYIQEFKLDGGVKPDVFIPGTLTGTHTVAITLSQTPTAVSRGASRAGACALSSVRAYSSAVTGVTLDFGARRNIRAAFCGMDGREAASFFISAGTVLIPGNKIRPGVYIVRWQSEQDRGTQKIVLAQ